MCRKTCMACKISKVAEALVDGEPKLGFIGRRKGKAVYVALDHKRNKAASFLSVLGFQMLGLGRLQTASATVEVFSVDKLKSLKALNFGFLFFLDLVDC